MGPPFWRWILIILRVLLGVSCTQSSCHGNFLPGGFYFAAGRNMVENHWLSGYVFETLTVSLPVQCFRKCRSNCRCISFNYLTTVNQPDNCELNEENKYLKPDALQPKEGSQYYDLVIDYNVVVGVNWIKINTSPVCFGARGNSYGVFTIPKAGHVTTFKLAYHSGYVSCGPGAQYQSNWGCTWLPTPSNLAVFITDDKKQRILPTDNALFLNVDWCKENRFYYSVPGFTADSPELRFNNFSSPLAVSKGEEFQIWYTEDLYDCSEGDNDGQTCADMYELYL
ncbi:hypothetical protein OS493_012542 [Desmophyllum pertusum]|uniref:Apple domain-containing protein n=1 Tax=Desmophyllum pertusum TaxID=174260 RepID=A0A9X0CY37_9CNID|nr:hypothetical protein OS493_012542 [Desmophyllum pertusum]